MPLRETTEALFERWSVLVVQHRWLVLLIVAGFTAAVLPQLRHLTVDVSIESYLSKTDASVKEYDAFREQFGNGSFGLITVETEELFTLENLARLRALHTELEASVPYLDEITSLVNVRHTRGEGDTLLVEELQDLWPKTFAEIPAFRSLVLSNPAYLGGMVSASGRLTNLILEPNSYSALALADLATDGFGDGANTSVPLTRADYLTPEEEAAFVVTLIETAKQHDTDGFRVHISGMPVMNYLMSVEMSESMMRNTLAGLGIIALLLYVLFRRFSGVVFPLLTVWLSMIVTIALMPLLGFPINGNSQFLPSFLLAVGIADAVHILSVFYKRYDAGMDKHAAITSAMKTTAVGVVMTSITTAAGLLSFATADLIPTRAMGIFGAIGVLLALYYSITLLPALLAVLPVRRRASRTENAPSEPRLLQLLDRGVFALGDFGVRRARSVLLVTSLVTIFALIGVSRLEFSHDPLRWYNPEHPLRVAADLVDAEMSGTQNMQVLYDTGQENGLYDPGIMNLLDEAKRHIETRQVLRARASQATSILEVIKETHKALNGGDENYYHVPQERETIAQELLLFESSGTDDLEDFTDSSFQVARFAVSMPFTNVIDYDEYLTTLLAELEEQVQRAGLTNVTISITGVMVIFARTLQVILFTMVKSYGLAFLLVGILMFLLMGGVRRGTLAFVPNIVPIIFTIGMMGWLGIPLNMLTSMVGCVIIGIAVDDTIHFMHHFRKISDREPNVLVAIHATLETVGRALLFTSIVLVGGFIVNIFDIFSSARHFGLLLSFSISIALIANLVLAPALIATFWRAEHRTTTEAIPSAADFSNT